jgi:uncharacterized protein (DUF4415 family)
MNAKPKDSNEFFDADDAPEISDEWIASADEYVGEKLIRRGRPVGSRKASPKRQTTIRFDHDVLEQLKATGRGWQTRVNDAMREWLKAHSA